jgi:alkylhydroperoxidase family enzyme
VAFERQWNYDASYLREIVEVSPGAAWRFMLATRLCSHAQNVPREALAAAALTAARAEGCGLCTQLAVAMAERQGVHPDDLRAILRDDADSMSSDAALAWRFTKGVLAHDPSANEFRRAVADRWGGSAIAALALEMTAARMYPTVKCALGHDESCVRLTVAGVPVADEAAPSRLPRVAELGEGQSA